jgi:predicted ATPase
MISRLHVENFKCLANVDVEFAPLTILIGPNDSGKTSLLEAIELLGQTTKMPWTAAANEKGGLETLVWMKDSARDVTWQVEGNLSHFDFKYSLSLTPSSLLPKRESLLKPSGSARDIKLFDWDSERAPRHPIIEVASERGPIQLNVQSGNTVMLSARQQQVGIAVETGDALSSTVKYRLQPDKLRIDGPIASNPVLSPSGDNLVSVLDAIMTHPNRKLILDLEEILRREVPTVSSISVVPSGKQGQGNLKTLQYVLATDQDNGQSSPATLASVPPAVIPAKLASDGLLLLTAFIAMAYTSSPDIIFIEEPENGIHYSRLKLIIDILRKLTTGEIGTHPRQVIITSHSPILLNLARPEEIRVFNRTIKGGTQIKSLAKVKNAERMLKEFAPGELWYLLGEEALVKEEQP